jgi:asparagine synthase (glutamine-hydrolysing)
MVHTESGMVLTFNGEIYNYLELRADLERRGRVFKTDSDTEVLLQGIADLGMNFLQRCNGMFAIAIWDPSKNRLFLARDRFGVKPLYYHKFEGGLIFASEPKALHILKPSLAEPDTNAIVDLIVRSHSHIGARTFYDQISSLPPAHYGEYDVATERMTLVRYWDYPQAEASTEHPAQQFEQFAELLESSVKLRFRSDVPVGLTLSGGLDSSAILAAAIHTKNVPSACFTATFSKKDRGEEHWARMAADYAGVHCNSVESNFTDWSSKLERIIDYMDAPGFSPAVLPLWDIMAQSREQQVPVLLEGQGADELLGGYPQYLATSALMNLSSMNINLFYRDLRRMNETFGLIWTTAWIARQALPKLARLNGEVQRLGYFPRSIVTRWRERPEDQTLSAVGRNYDPLRRALWVDHAFNILPSLLHYGDSIGMSHGIESRLPFMDYRLVEWVFRQSPELIREGRSKTLVRDYLHRQKFEQIADRADKIGFKTPVSDEKGRGGASAFVDLANDAYAPVWEIMNRRRTGRKLMSARSTRDLFHSYKILTVNIWLKILKKRRNLGINT